MARAARGVLDWRVLFEAEAEGEGEGGAGAGAEAEDEIEDEIVIGADEHALPGRCFVPVGERKTVKNRLHHGLAPDYQDAEAGRILALGARRVDVGKDEDVTSVALADPGGNEFCVLRPKTSLPGRRVTGRLGGSLRGCERVTGRLGGSSRGCERSTAGRAGHC